MGPGRLEEGRREEGREVAVRMTCVGGVREHDETRNCDATNAQCDEGKLAAGVSRCYRGSQPL
eukprot:scaffold119918_cov69-Phaeocystis_antarctica.AAC.5